MTREQAIARAEAASSAWRLDEADKRGFEEMYADLLLTIERETTEECIAILERQRQKWMKPPDVQGNRLAVGSHACVLAINAIQRKLLHGMKQLSEDMLKRGHR